MTASQVTLHHGDCLDVLRTLPDNSVDAIVTDPPYGLANTTPDQVATTLRAWLGGNREYIPTGKGFMGKAWDAFVPPIAVWDECLRVLKPGGHLLTFAGSRTHDLMTLGIRLAGFDIRDSIAWLYGCLSDDTEILTEDGWVRYDRATEGRHALAFDTDTGQVKWQPIEHVHRYQHSGEMVRLTSDVTDQLLTPNHRVVVAEGSPAHVPYVPSGEALRDLLNRVSGPGSLPVDAQVDVFDELREGSPVAGDERPDEATNRAQGPDGALRGLRNPDLEARRLAQEDGRGVLLPAVQRGATGPGVGETRAQGASGMDPRGHCIGTSEDDRSEQPRLEGRRYHFQEARELHRSQVRPGARVGSADGAQGRLHHGAPAPDGRDVRLPADPTGSHQPREPQALGQPTGEPDALAIEPRSQALRVGEDGGRGYLPSTRVEATRVDYAGVVWCITIGTGAFIARRNGLIFATGNSGFPKSLDVSKAIDKGAGATREVVGPSARHVGKVTQRLEGLNGSSTFAETPGMGASITAPATPAAQQWAGWGTALKPAFEPIVVARKPLESTVAANVLEWGTGALNIDGCRVGTSGGSTIPSGIDRLNAANAAQGYRPGAYQQGTPQPPAPAGRWPTNVLLEGSQADALDEQSGTLKSGDVAGSKRNTEGGNGVTHGAMSGVVGASYADQGGASRFFPTFRYQAKAPTRERPSYVKEGVGEGRVIAGTVKQCATCGSKTIAPGAGGAPTCGHDTWEHVPVEKRADQVAHPTVKPLALMQWLVRLVTPPGGVVLEPFAGSGTTVEACLLEGFRCIAIEREADYLPLIEARIARAVAAPPALFAQEGAA